MFFVKLLLRYDFFHIEAIVLKQIQQKAEPAGIRLNISKLTSI